MRILLLIALLTSVAVSSAWAKTYSCRDSSGRMHFSDNLQGLPEECLGKEKVLKSGNVDNLNFVPPSPPVQQSGIKFKHSVRAEERALQKTEQQTRQLHSRAGKLSERYRTANQEKRNATRSWSYNSRKIIKQADNEMVQVREGKQELLQELEKSKLSTEDKEAVRSLLDGIVAE